MADWATRKSTENDIGLDAFGTTLFPVQLESSGITGIDWSKAVHMLNRKVMDDVFRNLAN